MNLFRRRPEPEDDAEEGGEIIAERPGTAIAGRRGRSAKNIIGLAVGAALVAGLAGMWVYSVSAKPKTPEEKETEAVGKMRPGDGAVKVAESPPKQSKEPPPPEQAGMNAVAMTVRDTLRPPGAASAPAGASAASAPPIDPKEQARLKREAQAEADRKRKLAAPLTTKRDGGGQGSAGPAVARTGTIPRAEGGVTTASSPQPQQSQQQEGLGSMLRTTSSTVIRPTRGPDPAWNLVGPTVADCTVYTATDSTLPGFGKIELASDLMSEDGNNVLVERGSEIIIEQRGGIRQGLNRLFLVAGRLVTAKARLRIPLSAPLGDELGRPGLGGDLDTHLWAKLKGAVILTGVQAVGTLIGTAGSKGGSNNTNVILSPQQAQSVITEVVRDGMQIADVVTLPHAARCQLFIKDDIDFSEWYDHAVIR